MPLATCIVIDDDLLLYSPPVGVKLTNVFPLCFVCLKRIAIMAILSIIEQTRTNLKSNLGTDPSQIQISIKPRRFEERSVYRNSHTFSFAKSLQLGLLIFVEAFEFCYLHGLSYKLFVFAITKSAYTTRCLETDRQSILTYHSLKSM